MVKRACVLTVMMLLWSTVAASEQEGQRLEHFRMGVQLVNGNYQLVANMPTIRFTGIRGERRHCALRAPKTNRFCCRSVIRLVTGAM